LLDVGQPARESFRSRALDVNVPEP